MIVSLTNRFVETLKPNPLKDEFYWDETVQGFGVRVTKKGSKTYVVRKAFRQSIPGGLSGFKIKSDFRLSIGRHGQIDCKTAREIAASKLSVFTKNLNTNMRLMPAAEVRKKNPFLEEATQAELTFLFRFDEFCKKFLEMKRKELADNTWVNYASISHRLLIPLLKDTPLHKISRKQILEFRVAQAQSPTQFNLALSVLKGVFKLAEDMAYIDSNPANSVPFYRSNVKDKTFSKEELRKIWDYLDVQMDPEAKALQTAMVTGMRICEILQAKWENITYTEWRFPKAQAKTNVSTFLPLCGLLPRLLAHQKKCYDMQFRTEEQRATCPYVFFKKRVFREQNAMGPFRPLRNLVFMLSSQMVLAYFKKVLAHLGISTEFTTHDLRHAYASLLIKHGASIMAVQGALRHTSPHMIKRYVHHDSKSLGQTLETFEGILFPD